MKPNQNNKYSNNSVKAPPGLKKQSTLSTRKASGASDAAAVVAKPQARAKNLENSLTRK